jgi:hypothetical protein
VYSTINISKFKKTVKKPDKLMPSFKYFKKSNLLDYSFGSSGTSSGAVKVSTSFVATGATSLVAVTADGSSILTLGVDSLSLVLHENNIPVAVIAIKNNFFII